MRERAAGKISRTALLLTLVLITLPALCQSNSALPPSATCSNAADDAAIRRIAEQWKAAYNNGNTAAVAALYTQDATYLTQHFATGIVHGRDNIHAYVQRGVDAKYKLETIEVLSTHCSGDFAYTITRYTSNNAGKKDVGVNLVVLRKRKGAWLIVAHESAVPDPANAIQELKPTSP